MPLCTLRSFRTNNDKYTREMYTQGEMIKKSVYAQFRLLLGLNENGVMTLRESAKREYSTHTTSIRCRNTWQSR